ncbi:ABC transporter [Aureococcus anophagefferens]|uniref:ABC transporter n=1 Tax=Aureococcus anophagefferens TaxID=44056 RepID=A0ABR1FQ52_AURAN
MSEFSDATKASLAALLASAGVDDEDTVDYVVGLAEAGEWEALPEFLEGAGVDDEDAANAVAARLRTVAESADAGDDDDLALLTAPMAADHGGGGVAAMTVPERDGAGSGSRDIHVTDFDVYFGGSCLRDPRTCISRRARYGLVGPNGVGKTTLLRHMAAFDLPKFPRHLRVLHGEARARAREYDAYVDQRAHIQEFIDKFRYNAKRASIVQSRIKTVEKMDAEAPDEPRDAKPWTFAIPAAEPLSRPMLQAETCAFGYGDGPSLFENVDFGVDDKSRVAIAGPNGSGKSTLLKLLLGEIKPRAGEVHRKQQLKVEFFTQHHADQLDLNLSPIENVWRDGDFGARKKKTLKDKGRRD